MKDKEEKVADNKTSFWDISLFGWKPNLWIALIVGLFFMYGIGGAIGETVKPIGAILILGSLIGLGKKYFQKRKN